jgi:hypothetical protein
VRVKWGWIRNIPNGIPIKGWPRGKTGQTGFRNLSDQFPSGNLLKIESEILKLDLRTNKRDKIKMIPDTSPFAEKPEASTLY